MDAPELEINDDLPESIIDIDAIHNFEFGYRCSKCSKIIGSQHIENGIVDCSFCNVTLRVSKLQTVFTALIESSDLNTTDIFKINLGEIRSISSTLAFDIDKSELRKSIMALTGIFVKVNCKEVELAILNGDDL